MEDPKANGKPDGAPLSGPASGGEPSESDYPVVSLADGQPVMLRPVVAADRDLVARAFDRLSPESRYFRFWTHYRRLGDSMLTRLVEADQWNHVVWAAMDPERPDEPGFGAASFWRSQQDPELAEMSFTVADEAQRRGVGTLLLAVLWLMAERRGIDRFIGYTLLENLGARRWFGRLGAQVRVVGPQVVVRLALDRDMLDGVDSASAQRLHMWLDVLPTRLERWNHPDRASH